MKHHAALRDAIADRDADQAEQLALQNTREVRDIRLQMWHERNNPMLEAGASTGSASRR